MSEINSLKERKKEIQEKIKVLVFNNYAPSLKPLKLRKDKPIRHSFLGYVVLCIYFTIITLFILYFVYIALVLIKYNFEIDFPKIEAYHIIVFFIGANILFQVFRAIKDENEYQIELKKFNEFNKKEKERYDKDLIVYNERKNIYNESILEINRLKKNLAVIEKEISSKINTPVTKKINFFKSDNWDDILLLINESNFEERNILNKILKNSTNKSPRELINQIKDIAQPKLDKSNSFTYKQMLVNIGNHLKVNTIGKSVSELEADICQKQFKSVIDKLTPLQKEQLEKELLQHSKAKGFGKEIGSLAALTGAQLSGFGVYMAASTIVGGITSAIGVTLPFAFYTGMSSVLSTIIGPVGWIGLVGFALYKYNKVNYEKLIPAVTYIIALKYKS